MVTEQQGVRRPNGGDAGAPGPDRSTPSGQEENGRRRRAYMQHLHQADHNAGRHSCGLTPCMTC